MHWPHRWQYTSGPLGASRSRHTSLVAAVCVSPAVVWPWPHYEVLWRPIYCKKKSTAINTMIFFHTLALSPDKEILDLFLTRDVCYGEWWLSHSSVSQFLVLLSFSLQTPSTVWPSSWPGDGGSSARRQYGSAVPSRPTVPAARTSYFSPLAPANQHKIKSKTKLK